MKTIFELGEKDHALTLLPECDVPEVMPGAAREKPLHLPHVSYAELDQARSLADLIPYCDYSDFYANIGRLTRNYVEFLEENGLQHRYTLD